MSVIDKVERDMRRLETEGFLLLQDPELWVLKVTRQGRGWLVKQREYDDYEDDEYTDRFTTDVEQVRFDVRQFHRALEQIESL